MRPREVPPDALTWRRLEPEGALQGLPTAFVDDACAVDLEGVSHLHLTADFSDWAWLVSVLEKFDGPVTVDCRVEDEDRLRAIKCSPWCEEVRVVLLVSIPSPMLDELGNNDEVRLGDDCGITFEVHRGVPSKTNGR